MPDADEQLLKEEICDINNLEEEGKDENSCSDMDHEIDDGFSEDKDQAYITTGNVAYYAN